MAVAVSYQNENGGLSGRDTESSWPESCAFSNHLRQSVQANVVHSICCQASRESYDVRQWNGTTQN